MSTKSFTLEQRIALVEMYIRCKESPTETARKFNTYLQKKGIRDRVSIKQITYLINKWRTYGRVDDLPKTGRPTKNADLLTKVLMIQEGKLPKLKMPQPESESEEQQNQFCQSTNNHRNSTQKPSNQNNDNYHRN